MDEVTYANYSLILSLVVPINLLSNLGLPTLATKLLSDSEPSTKDRFLLIKGILTIKLVAVLLITPIIIFIYSTKFEISLLQSLLAASYALCLLMNQLLLDNVIVLLGKMKMVFLSRLLASSFKIALGIYFLVISEHELELALALLLIVEFMLVAIAVYYLKIRFIVPIFAAKLLKKKIGEIRGLTASGLIEYLISKSFIIIIAGLNLSVSDIASAAFLMNLAVLTLSGFSVVSRFEILFVKLYRESSNTATILENYIKMWQAQLAIFIIMVLPIFQDLSLLAFGDKYKDHFQALGLIILLGLIFQLSYVCSPLVHSGGKLNVFLHSNIFSLLLFALTFPLLVILAPEYLGYSVLIGLAGKAIYLCSKYFNALRAISFTSWSQRLAVGIFFAACFSMVSMFLPRESLSYFTYALGIIIFLVSIYSSDELKSFRLSTLGNGKRL